VSVFRLALAIPSGQDLCADFAMCVTSMSLMLAKQRVPGYENTMLKIYNRRASMLVKQRYELVKDALADKCTHILFVDSDQMFPATLAHELAKHGKRVIGCNVATKAQGNSIPTARTFNPEYWGGDQVHSKNRKGLQQVWRLGFGVILIDLEVFRDLPKPWFNNVWLPEADDYMGEDWFFCRLMEDRGVPIWIDHDVSNRVGHIGKWIYTLDGCTETPVDVIRKEVA
jgi:hypothetical protein